MANGFPLLVVAVLTVCAGCASSSSAVGGKQALPAVSSEMKSVALVIAAQSGSRFDQGSSLSDVLTGVLASAGYRVVESEDRADLVLRVSASKTEEPTLLALINVNG